MLNYSQDWGEPLSMLPVQAGMLNLQRALGVFECSQGVGLALPLVPLRTLWSALLAAEVACGWYDWHALSAARSTWPAMAPEQVNAVRTLLTVN